MVMAIMQSCCCWNTVRKGSYASAGYTMVYYMGCSFIMGVTIYFDLEYYWNEEEDRKTKNSNFLEPAGMSDLTMLCILIVFVLSIFGVFTSILLFIGLRFEIHSLLIPWMVILSISSFIDISHSIYWLTLDEPYFSLVTAMLFTAEISLCILNVYSLFCVYSQYQEYRAGRGTAAYDTLLQTIRRREQQTPSLSVRCSQQQATATSYLTASGSHSTRDSTSINMDNLKSRRVQFTTEDESTVINISPSKLRGSFLIPDKARIPDLEEEDDCNAGRSDFLWCAPIDERTLICDLPSSQDRENKESRSKKRTSMSEASSEKSEKSSKKK